MSLPEVEDGIPFVPQGHAWRVTTRSLRAREIAARYRVGSWQHRRWMAHADGLQDEERQQ